MVKTMVALAIKWDIIAAEDAEAYQYAYTSVLNELAVWASCLAVAWLLGRVLPFLVLLLLFKPLRQYAGGFHTGSYLVCYFTSVVAFGAVMAASHLPFLGPLTTALYVLLPLPVLLLVRKAPVESENRPTTANERRVFRKRALLVLCGECVLVVLLLLLQAPLVYRYFAVMAIYMSAFLIMLSVVHQWLQKARA